MQGLNKYLVYFCLRAFKVYFLPIIIYLFHTISSCRHKCSYLKVRLVKQVNMQNIFVREHSEITLLLFHIDFHEKESKVCNLISAQQFTKKRKKI